MPDHKKIAVITGASSGLGREFVRQLDEERTSIEEIWVIARREERLVRLQDEVQTPLRIFSYDLTAADTIDRLRAILEDDQPDIRLLINAAGMGKIGRTDEMSLAQINRMIDLNCRAAVDMTQICLPYMHEDAHIMEICSIAAFQPVQYMNVYAASKAFLYRYSRALRIELLPKNIYVTAVCPYWIKDTEFIPSAEGKEEAAGSSSEKPEEETAAEKPAYFRSFPFASSCQTVAATALAHTRLGLAVCTPGLISFLDRLFGKVLSSDLMMGVIALIRRIPSKKA